MSLVGGAPLVVEDLDVTMQVRTFLMPIQIKKYELDRLIRKIERRCVDYIIKSRPHTVFGCFKRDVYLKVGDREILYMVF